LLTLHDKKSNLLNKVKPLIKFITTIDFGEMTYKRDFFDLLKIENLEYKYFERIDGGLNPCLRLFKVYGVVCNI